jgi:chromosome segregation ATPase
VIAPEGVRFEPAEFDLLDPTRSAQYSNDRVQRVADHYNRMLSDAANDTAGLLAKLMQAEDAVAQRDVVIGEAVARLVQAEREAAQERADFERFADEAQDRVDEAERRATAAEKERDHHESCFKAAEEKNRELHADLSDAAFDTASANNQLRQARSDLAAAVDSN